ncbi:hypothetical protein NGRA_2592 [Nosema granulosis]|uniref:Ricin B lectin domain-containing protein n=1 Tax=Nosema granulosis TaxID=83296 RepID=A0A9P6KXJ8_9MICR|nr:hypothetical protein NGRA_2592 [Nosema granulosis]
MLLWILITFFTSSKQFRLKHVNKKSFICEGSKTGEKIPIVECEDEKSATDFKIETSSDGTGFFSPIDKALVFDVAEEWKVVFGPKHGETNQRFSLSFLGPDKYTIVNRGKCLTLESTKFHHMRDCKYSDDQSYEIVYNDSEKPQLTTSAPKDSVSGGSGGSSLPSADMTDRLARMIEDNKEIANRIAYSHNHHHYNRHYNHHLEEHNHHLKEHNHHLDGHNKHHNHDNKKSHVSRYEEGPYLLEYFNEK